MNKFSVFVLCAFPSPHHQLRMKREKKLFAFRLARSKRSAIDFLLFLLFTEKFFFSAPERSVRVSERGKKAKAKLVENRMKAQGGGEDGQRGGGERKIPQRKNRSEGSREIFPCKLSPSCIASTSTKQARREQVKGVEEVFRRIKLEFSLLFALRFGSGLAFSPYVDGSAQNFAFFCAKLFSPLSTSSSSLVVCLIK